MFARRTAALPCLRAVLLLLVVDFLGDVPSAGFLPFLRGVSASTSTGSAAGDSSGSSQNTTVVAPPCNTACCGATLRLEARLATKELSRWGSMDTVAIPQLWEANAIRFCERHCGNCTEIAKAMYDQCRFYLMTRMDMNLAITYCKLLKSDFEDGRCPAVCNATKDDCATPEGQECNAQCANYVGCECIKQRGAFGEPDLCVGETVLKGSIPGTMGLKHSCILTPRLCMNHHVGTECGRYRHCRPNLCLVKNISCPLRDTCETAGVCGPDDGKCYYTNKDDGALCDDGLFYTHEDTCFGGRCSGWEDKCLRYNVDCNTTNPCLVTEGYCDLPTGACVFQPHPDGTACASSVGGPADGTCDDGLCRRQVTDPCSQKTCPSPGPCDHRSECSSETGEAICRMLTKPEGSVCNDGNPATHNDQCIEGRCVGDPFRMPEFKRLGDGICANQLGKPVQRYFGDVIAKDDCAEQCGNDPECQAFSFGYHLCSIHGTRRARHPSQWGRQWWLGNLSGEIFGTGDVVQVLGAPEGDQQVVCYRKASTGDPAEDTGSLLKDVVLGILIGLLAILPGIWYICCKKAPKHVRRCWRFTCYHCCPRFCSCCWTCDICQEEKNEDEDDDEDEVWMDDPLPKAGASKIAASPRKGLALEDDENEASEDDRGPDGGLAGLPVAIRDSEREEATETEPPDPRGEVVHPEN